jgi:1-deoxy-D-xylulose-5-phosphate synthase
VTVEEGAVGGVGWHVLCFIANDGVLRPGLEIRRLTLPDTVLEHDDPARQYETAGLAAADIARVIAAHFVKKASARR